MDGFGVHGGPVEDLLARLSEDNHRVANEYLDRMRSYELSTQ